MNESTMAGVAQFSSQGTGLANEPKSPVKSEFTRQKECLSALQQSITALEVKLSPALMSPKEIPEGKSQEKAIDNGSLLSSINKSTLDIIEARARIARIIDRIVL